MSTIQFSELVKFRSECPNLITIVAGHDLIGRYDRMAGVLQTILSTLMQSRTVKVLDIGAYDRAFGKALAKLYPEISYYSLDVDKSLEHDFHRIEDVPLSFDVIAMFELVEHLPLQQLDDLLHKAYGVLAPGGCLFISTPNPAHPSRYFSDVSHVQHWPARDLYAELRHVGFQSGAVDIYGVVYTPRHTMARMIARARNIAWCLLGIERRGGLLAIAMKR